MMKKTIFTGAGVAIVTPMTVSYTHLDVYKRQIWVGMGDF